jgi:purine-nucleoside/S-methyl-5'-thioadenosine phosphorylase / adenosine deaminase
MLTADVLTSAAAVQHAFFTRDGGVSEGHYSSLNCGLGSGDDPERVRENRRRAAQRLGVETVISAYQVHSAHATVVEAPWPADARPQLDGLVTRARGLALGILTADCAPVLFADAAAGVIGAAHAGWRGAKAGILESTVAAMQGLGARVETIAAAVGPCIRQESYEVGADLRAIFVEDEPATATLFGPSHRDGHFRFDLAGYVVGRLHAIGIRMLTLIPCDTFADETRFFSYRRVTLAGGGDYGRLLSAIVLAP